MRTWVFPVLALVACGFRDEETHQVEGGTISEEIIIGEPHCGDCEIQLEEVATLGNPRDPAPAEDAIGISCGVARLASGDFLLLPALSKRVGETKFLFHFYSKAGSRIRRVQEYSEIVREDDQWIIGPAFPEGFWEGWIGRYSVSSRDNQGNLRRTLTRFVDWSPPLESVDPGFPFIAQLPPFLRQVRQDETGQLWVISIVSDPRWRPTPRAERGDWNVTPEARMIVD